MTTADLVKKLEKMLGEFARDRSWGDINIEVREGEVTYIRKTTAERVAAPTQERIRERSFYR